MLSAVIVQLLEFELPPQPAVAKHNNRPKTVFAGVAPIEERG
jgi:hypothetical protein